MALPTGFAKNLTEQALGQSLQLLIPRGLSGVADNRLGLSGGLVDTFLLSSFESGLLPAALFAAAQETTIQGKFLNDFFVLFFTRKSSFSKSLAQAGASVIGSTLGATGSKLTGAAPGKFIPVQALLPNFTAFVFRLNPTVEDRRQTRLRSTVFSKGGYFTQYWSSGMKVMDFKGTSGPLLPPTLADDNATFSIRETQEYSNFVLLRSFYESANEDVGLFFLGKLLIGVLADFHFVVDADDPFQIKYDFKFEAYPELREVG